MKDVRYEVLTAVLLLRSPGMWMLQCGVSGSQQKEIGTFNSNS